MAKNILFVFEGEKTEASIVKNLRKFFIKENTIITCAFCSTIYQIYKEIKEDEDLDTFTLLRERKQNEESLKKYNTSNFAEIYLFFDYDGHDPIASDEKLEKLLNFFDEETEKGKLYISYPMIESLKHFPQRGCFKNLKVKCKENIQYKKIVNANCSRKIIDFNSYNKNTWKWIIREHLKKGNYIVNNSYTYPRDLYSQLDVFNNQRKNYINVNSEVSVLNSFPVFIHDYYGNEKLKKLLK
ncbi:hypothetical protein [Chryseobacterium jejuense]|uniref:Uncharacterized protein n=1 Tax=Chryseobacterium jejuense TaxID=445960 RepID=A0ABY0Q6I0_CHRJE|nr:hypothetical protein [Chryseobacterium jejuense]SDJ57774.1 hypothetical protein SAMN05421542_3868 [Chryseobacterium jejuense]